MTTFRSTRLTSTVLGQTSQLFLQTPGCLAEAHRRRQIRNSYGRMSDAQLRDIGLIPWDLEVALSLPLDESAGDALAAAAAREAARW